MVEEFQAKEYTCDKCRKIVTVHIRQKGFSGVPDGWTIIEIKGNYITSIMREQMHFCSVEHFVGYFGGI